MADTKSEILDNNIGKEITYTPKGNKTKSAKGILVSYTYDKATDKATDNLTINIKGKVYGTTKVENIKRVDVLDENGRYDTLQYDIPQLFPQLFKTEPEATSGWQWPFAGKQEEPVATPGPAPETAAPETPGSAPESATTTATETPATETPATETPGSEPTEKKGFFSRLKSKASNFGKNISSKASNFGKNISSRFSGNIIKTPLPHYIEGAAAAAGGSKKSKTCKKSKKCKKSKTCKKSNKSKKTRKSKK